MANQGIRLCDSCVSIASRAIGASLAGAQPREFLIQLRIQDAGLRHSPTRRELSA